MSEIEKYFGPDGVFAQACHLYSDKLVPAEILEHAATLGESRIAYCLGWAFAFTLRKLKLTITDEDLQTIACNKISAGQPQEFVNGFKKYETQ